MNYKEPLKLFRDFLFIIPLILFLKLNITFVFVIIYLIPKIINKKYFYILYLTPILLIDYKIYLFILVLTILLYIENIFVKNKYIICSSFILLPLSTNFLFSFIFYKTDYILLLETYFPLLIFSIYYLFFNPNSISIGRIEILVAGLLISTYDKYPSFIVPYIALMFSLWIIDDKSYFNTILCVLVSIFNFYLTKAYSSFYIPIMAYLCVNFEIKSLIIFVLIIVIKGLKMPFEYTDFIPLFLSITGLIGYKKKSNDDSIYLLLDEINKNVMSFCTFIESFTSSNKSKEYSADLSQGITKLIDSYCRNCKQRNYCFKNKKLETYDYLKCSLEKDNFKSLPYDSKPEMFYSCIYRDSLVSRASELNQIYSIKKPDAKEIKMDEISNIIKNYFVYLETKIDKRLVEILNFKKLITSKYHIIYYDPHIISEDNFGIMIGFNKITNQMYEEFKGIAASFFKGIDLVIDIENKTTISIKPKSKYKVTFDSACISKDNLSISGDNHLIKESIDGRFICALADGMGSGYEAYDISNETISLIDKIGECNINYDTALDILNAFYKIKNVNESYSTLDFLDINLNNGLSKLYKMGASTTFLVRENNIIPIYNSNLPFGIDELITSDDIELLDNDLIIMISDGVSDYIEENILTDYIATLKNESPHKICYEILKKIYYSNNNSINDDMSCIALKLSLA